MAEFKSAECARTTTLKKVSRESTATMCIEARDCPHVLKIVLGLIAQHERVPFSIGARRYSAELHICVEISELSAPGAEVLLDEVTAIASVKLATWMRHTNAPRNLKI